MRKLKRPEGAVVEEFVCSSWHQFEGGKLSFHDNSPEGGEYTGVFWFEFKGGKITRRYTKKTAPAWLLALYNEATNQ